jgi:hypothetical protein
VTRSSEELEEAKQRRQQTSDDLVNSDARKKLVVAGPGTGKTHNFKRVLERSGGGLAITFIRALAEDLKRDLGDLAQVNTFHGYCKHLAHNFGGVGGLTAKFDYFPGLPDSWPRTWRPWGTTQSVETVSESPVPLVRRARCRSIHRVPAPFVNGAGTVVTLGMYGSRLASTTVSRSVSDHGRRRTTPSSSGGSG